ncbi:MAG: hypothetical protein KGJ57_16725 [Sphingomonadales bacterium]|nr:hypothetical protein [Sphingomonadales bacterium]MDE2171044.1 hypothetical protein [Sphingomonadales bacterium]
MQSAYGPSSVASSHPRDAGTPHPVTVTAPRRAARPAHSWTAFLPALGMAIIGLVGLALAWASPQQQGDQVLVIASPLASRAQTLTIIVRAGGRLVGEGRLANIALASSTDPDFTGKLRKAGAWVATSAPQEGAALAF